MHTHSNEHCASGLDPDGYLIWAVYVPSLTAFSLLNITCFEAHFTFLIKKCCQDLSYVVVIETQMWCYLYVKYVIYIFWPLEEEEKLLFGGKWQQQNLVLVTNEKNENKWQRMNQNQSETTHKKERGRQTLGHGQQSGCRTKSITVECCFQIGFHAKCLFSQVNKQAGSFK